MTEPTTNFKRLREAGACTGRYKHLTKRLGGITSYGRETPITLTQILDANGIKDALWALVACPDSDRFARHLACDFAEEVLPIFERQYPDDDRPRECIEVARRFADGEATTKERDAAWAAAEAAAEAAAWAAAGAVVGARQAEIMRVRIEENPHV